MQVSRRSFIAGTSAVIAVSLAPRLARAQLNPKDFGLVGDGHANDLPALRKMLAEVERKGKGAIKLPAGRFLLQPEKKGSALVLPANVRLEGAGRDHTILQMGDGAFGHVISAPYGWVQIADLTVDGNYRGRPGTVGHDIRVNGDQNRIERVRVMNSVSYGIAIGERRYARNVLVSDVEIINAGADGIDIKNDLARTEGIVIEKVVVRGFGRPDPRLPQGLIGTAKDERSHKAGVDLRGKCQVRDLTVLGVLPGRVGLRFRNGEIGQGHGPGAHNAVADGIVVRGTEGKHSVVGIAVVARNVRLSNVDVSATTNGVFVGAENLSLAQGKIADSTIAAIFARKTHYSTPDRIAVTSINFDHEAKIVLDDVTAVTFDHCRFSDCRAALRPALTGDSRVKLIDCDFGSSC